MQDPGEPGIQNISVSLTGDTNGDSHAETITRLTDPFGHYQFAALYPGSFIVEVASSDPNLPAASSITTAQSFSIDLDPGEDYNDADFGFMVPLTAGAIGDCVWNDWNGDGLHDPGEEGIGGVTIELWDAGALIADTSTDAAGYYIFEGLRAGNYQVRVTDSYHVLTGYTHSIGPDSKPEPYDYSLTSGERHLSADFGYLSEEAPGSIGDFVWNDLNGTGTQDPGEHGIGGVTIELRDEFGTPIDTATTDEYGWYDFTGLSAGVYTAVVTDTAGMLADYSPTTPSANSHTLGGDEDYNDADFGYMPKWQEPPLSSIGDTIWYDLDGDCVIEPGEAGIPAVTVRLKDCSNALITTAITDDLGHFSFSNLPEGCYIVEVADDTLPPGVYTTTYNDPMTVTLGSGEIFVLADFGYWTNSPTPNPTPTPTATPTPPAPSPTPTAAACSCQEATLELSSTELTPGQVVTADACIPVLADTPVDIYVLVRAPTGEFYSVMWGNYVLKGVHPIVTNYHGETCWCGTILIHRICEGAPGNYIAALVLVPAGAPPGRENLYAIDWEVARVLQ